MSGKRVIQKRSNAVQPKPRHGRLDFGLVVSSAASFAGAFAGAASVSPTRRYLDRMFRTPVGDGDKPAAAPPAGSASAASAGAAPASRFTGTIRQGGVRDFLRARFPGQKPHLAVAALTGIPEGTIRNAMAWNGPSELSGAHMLRLVAVFGPPFLAAVMDPAPRWVTDEMEVPDVRA